MHLLRGILKTLIALFVVWHIAAVGIYSLYHVEEQPVLSWLDSKRNFFRPYILVTSQWQRWNLFSPDPLRRVIEMEIQLREVDGSWRTFRIVNEDTVSFWRRATELKTIRRMENETMQPLQERYIHDVCIRTQMRPGTTMRLVKKWFVIPKHNKMYTKDWWNAWEPEWQTTILTEAVCPETL